MLKYAIFDYLPQRKCRRASFDQMEVNRRILDFKDGRRYVTAWAVEVFSMTLSALDLRDTVIAFVPASSHYSHVRRFRRFSEMLCSRCSAVNGFEHVDVCGHRKRAHVTHEYELRSRIADYVHIEGAFCQGRNVLVIDDICTTGQSAKAFISALQEAGAHVRMALFLAKTRQSFKF